MPYVFNPFTGTFDNAGSGSGAGITALTGDVTATGPGSVAATVNSVGGATATEIGYTAGVTSSIQTQLDGKANTSLSNLSATTAVPSTGITFRDAFPYTSSYTTVSTQGGGYLNFNLGGAKGFSVGTDGAQTTFVCFDGPNIVSATNLYGGMQFNYSEQSSAFFNYASSTRFKIFSNGTARYNGGRTQFDGGLDVNNSSIINLPTPALGTDAANKDYVDTAVTGKANTSLSNLTTTSINQDLRFVTGTSAQVYTKDFTISDPSGTTKNLTVRTGDGVAAGQSSGNILVKSGTGDTTGTVTITSGNGPVQSGKTTISTGDATLSPAATSGAIEIRTGSSSGFMAASLTGDISLITGALTGSGTRGSVKLDSLKFNIKDASLSSATSGYVWSLVNQSTGEGAWQAVSAPTNTWNKQKFTLSGTDITNQYIDLAQVAKASSVQFVVFGLVQGEGDDYTVNLTGGAGGKTRLTFAGPLATGGATPLVAGNVLYIQYQY